MVKWSVGMYKRNEAHYTCNNSSGKEMYEKLLVLVTLVFLIPQLSAGGTCSSQNVTDSIEQKIKGNYEQVDELLAPVSTFLQAIYSYEASFGRVWHQSNQHHM